MTRHPRMRAATRVHALDALALAREAERRGFHAPFSRFAKEAHSSVRSMRRVGGAAVRKVAGEWIYSPSEDRAIRTASILARTPDGPRWVQVKVKGLNQASKTGQFASAIERGQWTQIEQFKGKYITDTSGRRWYFETNRAALQKLDREGGLRPKGLQFT